MSKRIVVNVGLLETRVAVQEGNLLTELYLERHRHRSIVGSVYKGTVTNVLPGMQAAFVDIGLAKDAFLYAGRLHRQSHRRRPRRCSAGGRRRRRSRRRAREGDEEPRREATGPIEEMLSRGQDVLVQVSKESLGTKGARVTVVHLASRPLRRLHAAGASRRRLAPHPRRARARPPARGRCAASNLPPGGFIVRTNAEGKGEEEFAARRRVPRAACGRRSRRASRQASAAGRAARGDGSHLPGGARPVLARGGRVRGGRPRRLRQVRRVRRRRWCPALADRVRLYERARRRSSRRFGIEKDIEKALRRRVWLKSGGYIVIDHTEALVSIDVNTGKYVGKRDFEQTVLKINLEAVDRGRCARSGCATSAASSSSTSSTWRSLEHREQVYKALKRALAEDKARTNVLRDLRAGPGRDDPQARAPGPARAALAVVPDLPGQRRRRSPNETLATEIYRAIQAKAAAEAPAAEGREIVARVHPDARRATSRATARTDLERLRGRPRGQDHRAASRRRAREEYERRGTLSGAAA